jgi:cation transport ATPase
VIIASGDSRAAVAQVADALAIDEAHARLDPTGKIALVRELEARGRRVFVIGDGINDGPVLAAAHVSCAMGQGSAIAQAASDLLLIHENLAVLPQAIGSARAALRVVRQNLGWAMFYNLAAVPLAAFGLVPPWLAALGMSLSSLESCSTRGASPVPGGTHEHFLSTRDDRAGRAGRRHLGAVLGHRLRPVRRPGVPGPVPLEDDEA